MTATAHVILCALAAGLPACRAGNETTMNEANAALSKFKASVGFDGLTESGGPFAGVVVEWPSPATAPQLKDRAFQVDSFDAAARDGGAEGEWVLSHGDERVLLRAFVSSSGRDRARAHLLETASATMMIEIPFVETAQPIGSLSVTLPGGGREDTTFLWVYQNLCCVVRGIDTDVDVEGFARWVQSTAERGLVGDVRPHLPPIDRLEVEPDKIAVDGTCTVRVVLAPRAALDAARYEIALDPAEDDFDLEDESGSGAEATLRALRAGDLHVEARVVDRRTLLQSSVRTALTVTR